ncbi:MAG: AEC family transporter [Acetilactobacillus jinshanensis]
MLVLWNSIQSVLVIVLIMALGYVLRKKKWLADSFGDDIARLILNISLPAAIFVTVLEKLSRGKLASFSTGRKGTFINGITNPNTVFIGLPLNVALFGSQSLTYFLVYYVLDVFSTWTAGLFLINNDDPTQQHKKTHLDWKKILPVPLVKSSLTYVGSLVTPLSLIYIGIILADAGLKNVKFDWDTVMTLIGRFICVPAIMIGVLIVAMKFMPLPKLLTQTMVIQSAVPAIAVLPILVHNAHGDVKFSANVVSISTVMFIIVIPILMLVIQHL